MAELLISAGPGEWRAAWAENGEACELYVERGDSPPAGSRHLGRIVRLVPALDAALVDIGGERPGFLPLRDAGDGPKPEEGARIVVELRREAWQDKAPRLTGKLDAGSLAAAATVAERRAPPAQLFPPPGLAAALALRLPGVPERIVFDDAGIGAELRAAFPAAPAERSDTADWPLDLDGVFEAALQASLALPGGGSLHIDEARAATLVDVDTGSPERGSAERVALAANRSAASLIARQLRLRNIGGPVIVDFVGLQRRGHRAAVAEALAAALAGDPAKPQLLGWTRLGHVEIVRPRRNRSLADALLEPAARAKQPLALAYEALRRVQREARANPAMSWRISAAPAIAAALRGAAAPALRALEARLGRPIATEAAGLPGFDVSGA